MLLKRPVHATCAKNYLCLKDYFVFNDGLNLILTHCWFWCLVGFVIISVKIQQFNRGSVGIKCCLFMRIVHSVIFLKTR